MNSISKAIAAGVAGTATGGATGLYMLPDGAPWYATVIMALVTGLIPAVVTYMAPRNAD